jgi:hypothetical protein
MAAPDAAASRTRDSAAKTIEFVKLGFHDCSLNFTVKTGNVDVLPHFLDAAGPYNDFDPDRVLEALGEVLPRCMAAEFGRESSPVLSLEIPYWSRQAMHDKSRGMGRPLDETERREIAQRAVEALRAAGAETVSYSTVTAEGLDRHYLKEGEGMPETLPTQAALTVRGWWG